MSCPHCGAGDDTDRSAEAQGLVYMAEAARRAGRSATWINYRCADGDLQTRTYANRKYVTLDSLNKLLSEQGPNTIAGEIERLQLCGRGVEAAELHRAACPEAYPEFYGASMPTQHQPETVTRGDFAESFVKKWGG